MRWRMSRTQAGSPNKAAASLPSSVTILGSDVAASFNPGVRSTDSRFAGRRNETRSTAERTLGEIPKAAGARRRSAWRRPARMC
jgi:hypothetical protein